MKPETKKALKDIADLLIMFRIATLTFGVWCCGMFMWIVGYVMDSFTTTENWVIAFYATTVTTFVPLMFKVFNDLRDSYQRDSRHSESNGNGPDEIVNR